MKRRRSRDVAAVADTPIKTPGEIPGGEISWLNFEKIEINLGIHDQTKCFMCEIDLLSE